MDAMAITKHIAISPPIVSLRSPASIVRIRQVGHFAGMVWVARPSSSKRERVPGWLGLMHERRVGAFVELVVVEDAAGGIAEDLHGLLDLAEVSMGYLLTPMTLMVDVLESQ